MAQVAAGTLWDMGRGLLKAGASELLSDKEAIKNVTEGAKVLFGAYEILHLTLSKQTSANETGAPPTAPEDVAPKVPEELHKAASWIKTAEDYEEVAYKISILVGALLSTYTFRFAQKIVESLLPGYDFEAGITSVIGPWSSFKENPVHLEHLLSLGQTAMSAVSLLRSLSSEKAKKLSGIEKTALLADLLFSGPARKGSSLLLQGLAA